MFEFLFCRIGSGGRGLVLLGLMGMPLIGHSQIDFQEVREINGLFLDDGKTIVADVDNDGDLDILAVGNRRVNNVSIYMTELLLNDGHANFTAVENPFIDVNSADAAFGDIDNDGDLDLIIMGQETYQVPGGGLYINQGGGKFTVSEKQPFTVVYDPEVQFFDYNGDEHLDVFIAGSRGIEIRERVSKIYVGDGNGNFEEVADHGVIHHFAGVDASFGDIDGDGDEDFILTGAGYDAVYGVFLYHREGGKFVYKSRISGTSGNSAELADLDNDGDLDYLLAGRSGTVVYFLNDGKGVLRRSLNHPFMNGVNQPTLVIKDFDLDGDLDVLIAGRNDATSQNHIYLNDGYGNFSINPFSFPLTTRPGIAVGNFDGKGLDDIIFFGEERGKATMFLNNIDLNTPPVITDLSVNGEALADYDLKGSYTYSDEDGDEDFSTFQWFRADDGEGTNKSSIPGADSLQYKLSSLDLEKYISIEITPNDGKVSGEVMRSDWIGPIKLPMAEIHVSGNSNSIENGSMETSPDNFTYLGEASYNASISKTFTLENFGKADLVVESISLTGGSAEDFGVIDTEILPVIPGGTAGFTLYFSPAGVGERSTTVQITTNDPQNSLFTFTVSGIGLNTPPMFISDSTVEVEENATFVLDIDATDGEGGKADAQVSYTIIGGEDESHFQVDQDTGELSFKNSPDYENPEDNDEDNVYIVQVSADDGEAENNISVQELIIRVKNVDEAPVAVCKEGVSIVLNEEGKVSLTAEEVDGGSSDDLGIEEWTLEPSEFTCEDVGPVEVTLTIRDSGGNISSCTTSILVIDDQEPVISSVETITANNAFGQCHANIEIAPPLVKDNCETLEAFGIRSDGLLLTDPYPVGNTEIIWRIEGLENSEAVVQLVTVQDTKIPVINPLESITRNNDKGSNGAKIEIDLPEVSACSPVKISGIRSDNRALEDLFPIGETIITWTAISGELTAQEVIQKVIVVDNELPILEMPQDITMVSSGGNCGSYLNIIPPKVTDNSAVAGVPNGRRLDGKSLEDVFPIGETIIEWTAVDIHDNWAKAVHQTIKVTEREPDVITVSGPDGPRIIGSAIEMTAGFNDDNIREARWKILDGGGIVQESLPTSIPEGKKQISHSFENLPAGVYTVNLFLKYDCGQEVIKNYEYVVIYDPNGGFVTGGGWIYSPAGAMRDPDKIHLEGKANFGFNAKYKNGKNNLDQVDGETSFQFKAGDIFFKSSSHEAMSLVVSGGFKATYKGIGTVNGEQGYNFMVTVIDADKTQNHKTDLFRIKIWKKGQVLYDNNIVSDADNADPATAIGGGSIVIHKPKGGKTSEPVGVSFEEFEKPSDVVVFSAYPNPLERNAVIEFSLKKTTHAVLSLFDLNGKEVSRLYEGEVKEGQLYEIEISRNNLMEGVYIYRLTTGMGSVHQKQLLVK